MGEVAAVTVLSIFVKTLFVQTCFSRPTPEFNTFKFVTQTYLIISIVEKWQSVLEQIENNIYFILHVINKSVPCEITFITKAVLTFQTSYLEMQF